MRAIGIVTNDTHGTAKRLIIGANHENLPMKIKSGIDITTRRASCADKALGKSTPLDLGCHG